MTDKEKREYLQRRGMCVVCGKERAMDGRKYCYNCYVKNSIKHAKYYRHHKEELNKYKVNFDKKRREWAREQGICTHCFKRKAVKGRMMCVECEIKARRIKQEQYRKQGRLASCLRGNGEYCYFCCKPVENKGAKLCNKCHERTSKQFKEIRQSNKEW